jgi:hypothetical protein
VKDIMMMMMMMMMMMVVALFCISINSFKIEEKRIQ